MEAAKILCITLKVFTEISQAYKTFRDFIKKPAPRKVAKPKRLLEPKLVLLKTKYQRDYEPSNAIQVNECNFRRWVRVKEWFNEYSPDTEKFNKTILIE